MDLLNKIVTIGLLILIGINLFLTFCLRGRINEVDAHVGKMEEFRISLPPELQQKIAANYEQALKEQSGQLAELQQKIAASYERALVESNQATANYGQTLKEQADQLAGLKQKLDQNYEQALKEQSVKLTVFQQKITANYASALTETVTLLTELSKQKIAGNEIAAENAFKLALQCVKNNDLPAAKLYCLNAINHAPDRKQYFEELMKIQQASSVGTTVEDLEQISRVLELGLYQVNAEDVSSVKQMLESVSQEIDKLRTESAETERKQIAENTKQLLASVKTGDLSWERICGLKDEIRLQTIQERMTALNELLANSDVISGQEFDWCDKEIHKTNVLLEYTSAANAMTAHLNTAEKLLSGENSEKQLAAINSLIQTANGLLGQSWGLDLALLPQDYAANLKEIAQHIAGIEIRFNQIKSTPAVVKIRSIDEKIRGISEGKYTDRINAIQNHIREIGVLMQEVYDPTARRTVEKNLEEYSHILSDYNAARYRSYQAWAVEKCNEAFKLFSSWIRVDAKDAMRVIDTYLTTIDSSLLAPETMKLYQDVLSKQFAEMNWKDIAKYEARLATCRKMVLEDF